jgi:hypothetical protein
MHALQELGIQQKTARKVVHIASGQPALLSPLLSALPLAWYALVITAALLFPHAPLLGSVAASIREGRGGEPWTPVTYYAALVVISYYLQAGQEPLSSAFYKVFWRNLVQEPLSSAF